MDHDKIFDKDYESILRAKKASNTTDSESVTNFEKMMKSWRENADDKVKFLYYIRSFLNIKISMASLIGRKYTNFSTSNEPEILNKDTKDIILKYLKDEGFKVVLRERANYNDTLNATILVSWK